MASGGLRRGAGRKPQAITEMKKAVKANFAALILSDESERNRWKRALDSENEKVSLDALKALSEFKHGKAKQTMEVDGRIDVAQVIVDL